MGPYRTKNAGFFIRSYCLGEGHGENVLLPHVLDLNYATSWKLKKRKALSLG